MLKLLSKLFGSTKNMLCSLVLRAFTEFLEFSCNPSAVSTRNCSDKADFFHLTRFLVKEKTLYLSQHNYFSQIKF